MNDKAEQPPAPESPPDVKSRKATATQFLLRGLAISLPPILTLVILLWVFRGINDYIIYPISTAVQFSIAFAVQDVRPVENYVVLDQPPPLEYCDTRYRVSAQLKDEFPRLVQQFVRAHPEDEQGETSVPPAEEVTAEARQRVLLNNLDQVFVPVEESVIPYADYAEVAKMVGPRQMPSSPIGIYMELATTRYFKSLFNLSAVAVIVTIVSLYFLGRFVTARVGNWIVNRFETRVMARLPLVSNVYSSVKQVTDFVFKDRTLAYNRVVAVEYPRPGVWSIAFVTNDGLLDITAVTGEPMLTVLVATSPMPMTGFTTTVRRRDVIDLNLTLDQAFQFCLSCGVLIPPQQRVTPELLQQELARRWAAGHAAPATAGSTPLIERTPANNDHFSTPQSGDGMRTTSLNSPPGPDRTDS